MSTNSAAPADNGASKEGTPAAAPLVMQLIVNKDLLKVSD